MKSFKYCIKNYPMLMIKVAIKPTVSKTITAEQKLQSNVIMTSIMFKYNAKEDYILVYLVSIKNYDSNDAILPSSFNQSFKRLDLSTLLFLGITKLCMVNNAKGTTIY